MKKIIIFFFIFSVLYSQVLDTLYLSDSLGGCSDLDDFILNPIMNRIYIWSVRSHSLGNLNCETGDRQKPFHNIHDLSVYNQNNNYLYSTLRDTNLTIFVIDCSTQVVIDTIVIHFGMTVGLPSLTVNVPANKIFCTTIRHYNKNIDSTFTYIIDGQTNQIIGRVNTFSDIIQHRNREIAYSFSKRSENPIYVIDVENNTISDSIIPPDSFMYYNLFLSSETERLYTVAFSYQFPYNLLQIIDCVNNQIIGEMQLPISLYYVAQLTYNSVNNKLYVSTFQLYPNDKIYIIDLNYLQIVDSIILPFPRIGKLIYNSNNNCLYLFDHYESSVKVIDGVSNQIIDDIPLPYPAGHPILNLTLNKLFLHDSYNIYIIDCSQQRLERYFKMAYMNQYTMWQPVTNRLYINDVCGDTLSSVLTVYDANTHFPIKVINLSDYVPPGEWFYHFTTATQVNKIYLTSGQERGIYTLDGNSDSLINFIPCEVGGHYLLYNSNQNKIYTIPFTGSCSPFIYIIDCEDDLIRNMIDVGESGNGYFNPYNNKVYATISYGSNEFKVFIIDGIGDTVIKVLDSLGLPLAFRNKENIHQVYIGSVFRNCIYVFDANNHSIIDSVINVPVRALWDQFFYYDSIDDRIYYPLGSSTLVIDCPSNTIIDTIIGHGAAGMFPEENFWNPASNRFYTYTYDSLTSQTYIDIIDCQTNTVITSFSSLFFPDIMQWNSTNNVIYVNDHWRSKLLAIRDDLISIKENKSVRILKELLVYPSIGNKFIIKRKKDEEMRIYDVCGRIVKRIGKKETIIEGKNLSPGVYFIKVHKSKTKNIQKFIVVR